MVINPSKKEMDRRSSNLETNYAPETSHLPFGKIMFRMTWQSRVINTFDLQIVE